MFLILTTLSPPRAEKIIPLPALVSNVKAPLLITCGVVTLLLAEKVPVTAVCGKLSCEPLSVTDGVPPTPNFILPPAAALISTPPATPPPSKFKIPVPFAVIFTF